MSRAHLTWLAAVALAAAAGGIAGFHLAGSRTAGHAAPDGAAPEAGRRVLYWYDPMYPQSRFDKPGKSPFMDMQLVPKYADEAAGEGGVTVSPHVAQNLGVRTAEARIGPAAARLAAVGTVEYDERSLIVVQPRASGFVEKLHVRATLDPVRAGAPLVEILFPEWAAAQDEYLLVRRFSGAGAEALAAAARRRLVLLGMSEEEIAGVEREGKARTRVTLRAPVSGVVAELGVREGMTVAAGTMLFRIAGLATVWVLARVPEAQAGLLRTGAAVEVRVPAYPEARFRGRVGAILPELDAATRAVRARIEVANPGGRLKPGMYAHIEFAARGRETLLVPAEALIRTGKRSVVILAEAEGRFRAVEVEAGAESGEFAEIRSGLTAGDRVVVSGQFLIDSEASLRSTLARLSGPPPAGEARPGTHRGRGRVTGVEAARGTVEIEHEPMPALKWPAMTMPFVVPDRGQLAKLRKGDGVEFEVRGEPDREGQYVIERIQPSPGHGGGEHAAGKRGAP
ncbi:MAG: efflux RND transporter periplasmic adaptor subunit [Burkholderiales bacterium]|nr:efflux RND transporter periplasmic adaptor subunit [Burkholderiales bacterium]